MTAFACRRGNTAGKAHAFVAVLEPETCLPTRRSAMSRTRVQVIGANDAFQEQEEDFLRSLLQYGGLQFPLSPVDKRGLRAERVARCHAVAAGHGSIAQSPDHNEEGTLAASDDGDSARSSPGESARTGRPGSISDSLNRRAWGTARALRRRTSRERRAPRIARQPEHHEHAVQPDELHGANRPGSAGAHCR